MDTSSRATAIAICGEQSHGVNFGGQVEYAVPKLLPVVGSSILNPQESYMNLFNRFVREDEGQDLIEYALLAGLISLVCVVAITAAGLKVGALFGKVTAAIP